MFKKTMFIGLMFLFATFISLNAQGDRVGLESQGGIGIQVGGEATIGGHAFYYLTPDMSIGVHFGFTFDGGDSRAKATTAMLFAPYFNYYFTKLTNTIWLFGQGCFVVNSGTYSEYNPNTAKYETISRTGTAFNINLGAEWRLTSTSNFYAGFNFLNLNLDPTRIKGGLGGPFIGVNFVIF